MDRNLWKEFRDRAIRGSQLLAHDNYYCELSEDSESYGHFSDVKGEGRPESELFIEVPYCSGSDYSGQLVERSNFKVFMEELQNCWICGDSEADYGDTIESPEEHECEPYIYKYAWDAYGGHGTFAIYLRIDTPSLSLWKLVNSLDDYPLLDESDHSEMEMEAQEENWDSWAAYEFKQEVREKFGYQFDRHKNFCCILRGRYNRAATPAMKSNTNWYYSPQYKTWRKRYEAWSTYCLANCFELENLMDDISNSDLYDLFYPAMEAANVYWENEQGDSMHIDITAIVAEVTAEDMKKFIAKHG